MNIVEIIIVIGLHNFRHLIKFSIELFLNLRNVIYRHTVSKLVYNNAKLVTVFANADCLWTTTSLTDKRAATEQNIIQ